VDKWAADNEKKRRSDAIRDLITYAIVSHAIDGIRAAKKKE
jgi:hypothetical protein